MPVIQTFPVMMVQEEASNDKKGEPSNADLMEKLNTMMGSMALKADLEDVKNDMGGRLLNRNKTGKSSNEDVDSRSSGP